MGLTGASVGKNALHSRGEIPKGEGFTVALAGNPNVGKSTVFNALTGLHQHTGNWTGKTVDTAVGCYKGKDCFIRFVDLPGGYSLAPRSAEEDVARDFLLFGGADAVIVVCDATRLSRNLGLVYQIMEITPHVLLCLNLMDEAKKEGIFIDIPALEDALGIPVVPASAGRGEGISDLIRRLPEALYATPRGVTYGVDVENAVDALLPYMETVCGEIVSPRFGALRLLENEETFLRKMRERLGTLPKGAEDAAEKERNALSDTPTVLIGEHIMRTAEKTAKACSRQEASKRGLCKADMILTSRLFGIPAMLLLLAFLFWLSITGASYPSALLSEGFRRLEAPVYSFLSSLGIGKFLTDMLTFGLYRILGWIVSVMLPPMAIFFPLFTFLEDVGYLPRIAYNLDGIFSRHHICGKLALTMCMGLGCNAAGVVGARIMDTEKERKIAILTNSFMPCNGRFPAILAVSSLVFAGTAFAPFAAAVIPAAVVVLGVLVTLLVADLLSRRMDGEPSPFLLELPPYRMPNIGRILVRSVLDRTVFILCRAAAVAAPAGILIFLLSNVTAGGTSIAAHVSSFLDPLGRLMGLDGVLLFAFLLGFPANEIVLPLAVMLYLSEGTLSEIGDIAALGETLRMSGWTWETGICFILFSLLHFPCSTTVLTVKKETGSLRMAFLSFLLPTAVGMAVCILFHGIVTLFA